MALRLVQPTPTLIPGSGFIQPTSERGGHAPKHVPGADVKAIARWDVVPHQRITKLFGIGVVAFHCNGIKEVRFSLNQGSWQTS